MSKRTKPRSPSTKLRFLADSFGLEGDALVSFCKNNGVTVEELLSWRDLALTGIELSERDGLGVTRKEHDKKVAELEKELRRKNDALAEAAALIVLQKKFRSYSTAKSECFRTSTHHRGDRRSGRERCASMEGM